MSYFRVPEQYLKGFQALLNLPDSKIKILLTVFEELQINESFNGLSKLISKKVGIPQSESIEIIKVTNSLYSLKENENKSSIEIANKVSEAIKILDRNELKPINNDWDKFNSNLENLLSDKNKIGITFKALNLYSENAKNFVDSKIITDIRPIFSIKVNDKIETTVIIHNFKIEYNNEEDKSEVIFITLDNNDLKQLKGQIERAEKKTNAIENW